MVKDGTENALSILATKARPNSGQKLWEYMTKNMASGNTITLLQSEAASELGISRQQVYRNLKKMLKHNLLVLDGKSQNNNIYMLNPEKVFRGKLDTIDRYVAKFAVLRSDITGD